jgi:hypothetical protein
MVCTAVWYLSATGQTNKRRVFCKECRLLRDRMLQKLRTLLGRVSRNTTSKIECDSGLEAAFAQLLMLAPCARKQQLRGADPRSISCTCGKSIALASQGPAALRIRRQRSRSPPPSAMSEGGQFVAHVKVLSGNHYDGHGDESAGRRYSLAHPRGQGLPRKQRAATIRSGSSSLSRSVE